MMKRVLLSLFALACFGLTSKAQIQTPAPSPASELTQMVGLTEVTITYSRPSMKGREIFGKNTLVPYGQMWRTGANAATKFAFDNGVTLGGKKLEAGEYAVLTKPNAKNWQVMLYPYESGSWNSYVEKEPAVVFTVPVRQVDMTAQTFTINVANLTNNSADIVLRWANTMVAIPMEVNTKEQAMASIKRAMGGPTANDYYAAASYLHDEGEDLEKALEYIQKANAENPRFWTMRREALILHDLGQVSEAITAAEKSMKMAKEAGNMDYVRMNQASLDQWQD